MSCGGAALRKKNRGRRKDKEGTLINTNRLVAKSQTLVIFTVFWFQPSTFA